MDSFLFTRSSILPGRWQEWLFMKEGFRRAFPKVRQGGKAAHVQTPTPIHSPTGALAPADMDFSSGEVTREMLSKTRLPTNSSAAFGE
ncbi:hypothetical protein ACU4HD_24870 [Cupriavidus basilensis]